MLAPSFLLGFCSRRKLHIDMQSLLELVVKISILILLGEVVGCGQPDEWHKYIHTYILIIGTRNYLSLL